MEEEVEEEYKAAATVDSRRACPSGCPRAVRGGVTATRRQAALGRKYMASSRFLRKHPHSFTLPIPGLDVLKLGREGCALRRVGPGGYVLRSLFLAK